MTDLDALRQGIDAVDDRILELLHERAQFATAVAEEKEKLDLPFYVPSREREILERLTKLNAGRFPPDAVRAVFKEIFSACLAVQRTISIAYLGPESTFTHLAVQKQFGLSARTISCGTISTVFDAVDRGSAQFGVVPVENSTEGVVNHTLDSFIESELKISAEIVLEISQCLLVRSGLDLGRIERVYSHAQALAQCRQWIAGNVPRAATIEASSTAEAARIARDDNGGAAIASPLAAKLYDLEILRDGIQDLAGNVTRFLVIGQKQAGATGRDKTSLLISLGDQPGSLLRVLEPFARNGVNMSKIESRPSRKRPWEYVFFVDIDGHAEDAMIARAIADVNAVAQMVRVLGSYPRADTPS